VTMIWGPQECNRRKGVITYTSAIAGGKAHARESETGSTELEVIACSLEEASAAWKGGASRREVSIRLGQGGPPTGVLPLNPALCPSTGGRVRGC
jgi:hypothetical protein